GEVDPQDPCDTGAAADGRELADRLEREPSLTTPAQAGSDVASQQLRLPECVLRGRGIRPAVRVRYEGAIAQRPDARPLRDLHERVRHHPAPPPGPRQGGAPGGRARAAR